MDFCRELRLDYAREQLMRTTRPITHIACECGFSDSSHFARCYRRAFGESPSDSRREAARTEAPVAGAHDPPAAPSLAACPPRTGQ
jgi:transcriptional regulator GlxA family with amidase domain